MLVLESGWTLVGVVSADCPDCHVLAQASVVRKYGAGTGVSGIASKKGTEFDAFNVEFVRVPRGKVLFSFAMPAGWSPK